MITGDNYKLCFLVVPGECWETHATAVTGPSGLALGKSFTWHFPGGKGSWAGVCAVRMYTGCSKSRSDALEVKEHTLMFDFDRATLAHQVFKFCGPHGAHLQSFRLLPWFLHCALFRAALTAHLENLDDEEVSYLHFVHFIQYRPE